jgi:2-octaprenylphenol hydroxylase
MTKRTQPYQLVIAGAGPVGLLFAAQLIRRPASKQFRIRIVDAQPAVNWRADKMDPRVYALSRESQWLLGDRWASIVKRRSSPYRCMRVWEGESPGENASIAFDAADVGEPDLGHIVEDSLLRAALHDELARTEIEISFGVGVETIARCEGRLAVTLSDGTTSDADLVVGADGANSKVRSAVGIEAINKSYRQRAVVSHITTEKRHDQTAWQRFLPDGPLAFLPLSDGRSSIVWTNTEPEADRLLAASDDEFLRALEIASAGVLGRLGPCTERIAFGLRLTHAVRYVAPGVALIGDSAHAVHPLAGQGMNLGLRDSAALADTLAAAVSAGAYPGDERVLKRYERTQKAHNVGMQLAFDGLNELFSRRFPVWAIPMRGIGLGLVDRIGPAKRLLMRQALGIDRRPYASLDDNAA